MVVSIVVFSLRFACFWIGFGSFASRLLSCVLRCSTCCVDRQWKILVVKCEDVFCIPADMFSEVTIPNLRVVFAMLCMFLARVQLWWVVCIFFLNGIWLTAFCELEPFGLHRVLLVEMGFRVKIKNVAIGGN